MIARRVPDGWLLAALALLALLDVLGALHVYRLQSVMGSWTALGGALVVSLIALMLLIARAPSRLPGTRAAALLAACAWAATAHNLAGFLVAAPTPGLWLALAAGLLALLTIAWRRPHPAALFATALALGSVARLLAAAALPITPEHGDMLPLVRGALQRLLAGQSPYAIYAMPWPVPLTYLPISWLAYLPPALLGLDIRLSNLIAETCVGVMLWRRSPAAAGLWSWMFLQPSVLNWSLTTTAPIWWAVLAAVLAALIERRHSVWLWLGLAGATSPFAIIVAPFVIIARRADGWRKLIRGCATALLVGAAWLAPFLIWDAAMVQYGVWLWFNDLARYPRLRWELDHTWAAQLGFSGSFWRRGLEGWLKPIQIVILLLIGGHTWWRGRSDATLIAALAAALLLFMAFNPVLWPYLYQQAAIACLWACATRPPPSDHAFTV
jgi:hypothetical protein